VLTLTGAIVIKSPSFEDCVDGMIWKISREHYPNEKDIIKCLKYDSKNSNHPIFIDCYDLLSEEIQDMISRFNDFINYILNKHNQISEMLVKIKKESLSINIALIKDQKVFNGFKLTKSQQ
jgi:hypothetical protein